MPSIRRAQLVYDKTHKNVRRLREIYKLLAPPYKETSVKRLIYFLKTYLGVNKNDRKLPNFRWLRMVQERRGRGGSNIKMWTSTISTCKLQKISCTHFATRWL